MEAPAYPGGSPPEDVPSWLPSGAPAVERNGVHLLRPLPPIHPPWGTEKEGKLLRAVGQQLDEEQEAHRSASFPAVQDQADGGSDEWRVEADPAIVLHRGVKDDELLSEDFWQQVGLTTEKRRWLDEASAGTKVCSAVPSPSPPPGCGDSLPPHPRNRPKGRSFKKEGWAIRPWKGPLPRTKPKTVVMLADFMPKKICDSEAEESTTTLIQSQAGSETTDVQNLNIFESPVLNEPNNKCLQVGPTMDLFRTARAYGRSRLDLFPRKRPFRLTHRSLSEPERACPSLLLQVQFIRTPASHTTHSDLTEPNRTLRPTYAAMAARPPAPHRRGPPAGRDRDDRDAREQFRRPPPRGDHGRPSVDRPGFRGNWGGRDNQGPRGYAARDRLNQQHNPSNLQPRFVPRDGGAGSGDRQWAAAHGQTSQEERQVAANEIQQQDTEQAGAAKKVKKPKPPHCFRCKTNGHTLENCVVVLDCVICNKKNDHRPARCPILKLPKPDASMFGFGAKEMGFFRIPNLDIQLEEPECTSTGLVKVIGGSLSAEVLQQELSRISRSDWTWEAIPHGNDAFLVNFPSVDDLKRMVDIDYSLKNHKVTITVSEWSADGPVDPIYQLEEVWIHVTGIPHAWRHYLVFWALGSVVGFTEDVDMHTYRHKGIVRIKVGIMNKELLPITTDVVFGKLGYNITFSLEPEGFEPKVDNQVSENQHDRDSEGNKDDDRMQEDGEQLHKRLKGNDSSNSSSSVQPEEAPVPMQTVCKDCMVGSFSHSPILVTKPPDGAEKLCAELTLQSLRKFGFLPNPVHSQSSAEKNLMAADLNDNADVMDSLGLWKNQPIPSNDSSNNLSRPAAGSRTADHSLENDAEKEKITADHSEKPAAEREKFFCSTTSQGPSSDEKIMDKAMRRTAEKNLDGIPRNKAVIEPANAAQSHLTPPPLVPGYLCSSPLGAFLGYPSENGFTGSCYGGFTAFGSSGYGYLLPGAWVAV
ncbi:hypothetical protein U9M48_017214 [Paspalum notatum var. saurae]|uniref:DUF4283 domain-containing protein n=1 Tax=Paspalum notatum var. saurae TaxID=547442 RepID=A0AAQ3T8Z5_PASNO